MKRFNDPVHILTGMIPAVFLMMNTGLSTWHYFPVCAPQRMAGGVTVLSASTRALAEDAREMCLGVMNIGDILRVPKTPPPEPDVG
ncbi:hypothetical protein BV20DRAFT_963125 [Pilatotrama ljubarskyi]|nr:hypothetical protein BV20DRAFT_963125 [Pilatotrama ljubarskyi]